MILKKKSYWTQNVFLITATIFVQNISHHKDNWARYDEMCVLVIVWSVGYYRQTVMEIGLRRQFFEK